VTGPEAVLSGESARSVAVGHGSEWAEEDVYEANGYGYFFAGWYFGIGIGVSVGVGAGILVGFVLVVVEIGG